MNTLLGGRYRLDGEIARGAIGVVWRAVDTTKRLVVEAQSELLRLPINKYSLAMQDIGDFLSNIVDQFDVAA